MRFFSVSGPMCLTPISLTCFQKSRCPPAPARSPMKFTMIRFTEKLSRYCWNVLTSTILNVGPPLCYEFFRVIQDPNIGNANPGSGARKQWPCISQFFIPVLRCGEDLEISSTIVNSPVWIRRAFELAGYFYRWGCTQPVAQVTIEVAISR